MVGGLSSPIRAICDGYTLIFYRALEHGIIQCYTATPSANRDTAAFHGTFTHNREVSQFTLRARPDSPYFEFEAQVRVNIAGGTQR